MRVIFTTFGAYANWNGRRGRSAWPDDPRWWTKRRHTGQPDQESPP